MTGSTAVARIVFGGVVGLVVLSAAGCGSGPRTAAVGRADRLGRSRDRLEPRRGRGAEAFFQLWRGSIRADGAGNLYIFTSATRASSPSIGKGATCAPSDGRVGGRARSYGPEEASPSSRMGPSASSTSASSGSFGSTPRDGRSPSCGSTPIRPVGDSNSSTAASCTRSAPSMLRPIPAATPWSGSRHRGIRPRSRTSRRRWCGPSPSPRAGSPSAGCPDSSRPRWSGMHAASGSP